MKDIITSVVAIIAGVTVFIYAAPLAKDSTGLSGNPALFPQAVSAILAGLGVVLLIRALWYAEREQIKIHKKTFLKIVLLFLIFISYFPTIRFIGYILATIIFLFAMMILLGSSKIKAGTYTLIISLSLHLTFSTVFKVPLPSGVLWN